MDFTPKQYLFIYALIVTPILLSFLFMKRGSSKPTTLKLDQDARPGDDVRPESRLAMQDDTQPAVQIPNFSAHRQGPNQRPSQRPKGRASAEKSLNVLFNWNGHTWDAYEVLDVPAGSSRDAVKAAYQKLIAKGDTESMPFFKAAFDAIMTQTSKRP